MNGHQLYELLQSGIKPVVTFKHDVLNFECFCEPGMRAQITSCVFDSLDMIKIVVDYTQFEEFNKQFETSNYYDEHGVACLTAREADQYENTETIYFMIDHDDLDSVLEVEQSAMMKLYEKYVSEKSNKTYIQWLEAQLI